MTMVFERHIIYFIVKHYKSRFTYNVAVCLLIIIFVWYDKNVQSVRLFEYVVNTFIKIRIHLIEIIT